MYGAAGKLQTALRFFGVRRDIQSSDSFSQLISINPPSVLPSLSVVSEQGTGMRAIGSLPPIPTAEQVLFGIHQPDAEPTCPGAESFAPRLYPLLR